MKPVVIYDMDDTITLLSDYVLNKSGVKPEQFPRYRLEENGDISLEKRKIIQNLWGSTNTFREVKFDTDIDKLIDISKSSAIDFKIHSLSFTEEIVKVKKQRLINLGFGVDKLYLDIGNSKNMKMCDIMVEDSITNLYNSLAKYKIIIDRHHNQAENYPEYESLNVIRVKNLFQANSEVITILKEVYNIKI